MIKTEFMFSISFVSRETGISAATLRKWEQRYGFPKPQRKNGYTRTYNEEELMCLREVKRRIEHGARPSQLLQGEFRLTLSQLPTPQNEPSLFINQAINLLIAHKIKALRLLLDKALKKKGVLYFVEDIAAPLTAAVGEQWAKGNIDIFTEHCYSQQMQALLSGVVKTQLSASDTPRVLLATLPGECHTLGLAMVQALLFEQNAGCINLGSELPLAEFPKAVQHYQAAVVGLSFSLAFPKKAIVPLLTTLRASLAPEIDLWIGGTGAAHLTKPLPNVQILTSPAQIISAYSDCKARFNSFQKIT